MKLICLFNELIVMTEIKYINGFVKERNDRKKTYKQLYANRFKVSKSHTINLYFTNFKALFWKRILFRCVVLCLHNDVSSCVLTRYVYHIYRQCLVHCIVGVTAYSLFCCWGSCWKFRHIKVEPSSPVPSRRIWLIYYNVLKLMISIDKYSLRKNQKSF